MNQDGKEHGKGVASYGNGHRYEGGWTNGFQHGNGTMTYADGRVESGQWEYMKFLG